MKVLILGGTGTLGKALIPLLLKRKDVERIRVLARNEHKINEMRCQYKQHPIDFIIGDIRDYWRVVRAMDNINVILHLAAFKTVDGAEYNPSEATATNIIGTENIIRACQLHVGQVKKAFFISTDKAVDPVTVYGKTKSVAESEWIQGNIGKHDVKFSAARYGNVLGSQGSVAQIWAKSDILKVSDATMTRFFWLPIDAAQYVLNCMDNMRGAEVYLPFMKSIKIDNLAKIIGKPIEYTGLRCDEKLHEYLISPNETSLVNKTSLGFIRYPSSNLYPVEKQGVPIEPDMVYSSDKEEFYTDQEVEDMLIATGLYPELEVRRCLKGKFML